MTVRPASTHQVTFDWQIAGHSAVRSFLEQSFRRNQLAQAICFHGPAHVGKSATARRFAQILMCRDPRQRPCGRCRDCRMMEQGSHPDCHIIELASGETSIGIDDIRQRLLAKLSLSSMPGGRQVAIIDDTDHLTSEAASSLLKTLEEPAGNAVLLLVSEKLSNLPATIVSRCQTVRFGNIDEQTMREFLGQLTRDRSERDFIARLAAGRPGIARRVVGDQPAQAAYRQQVDECLGLIDQPAADRFRAADSISQDTEAVQSTRRSIALWRVCCRDLLLTSLGLDSAVTNEFALRRYRRLLPQGGPRRWRQALETSFRSEELLDRHVPPKAVLDTFFLQMP